MQTPVTPPTQRKSLCVRASFPHHDVPHVEPSPSPKLHLRPLAELLARVEKVSSTPCKDKRSSCDLSAIVTTTPVTSSLSLAPQEGDNEGRSAIVVWLRRWFPGSSETAVPTGLAADTCGGQCVGVSTLYVPGTQMYWCHMSNAVFRLPLFAHGYTLRSPSAREDVHPVHLRATHLCWLKQSSAKCRYRPVDAQKEHQGQHREVTVTVSQPLPYCGGDTLVCSFSQPSSCKGCPLYADVTMYHPCRDNSLTVRVGPVLVLSRKDQTVTRRHGPWGQSLRFPVEQAYEGRYGDHCVSLATRGAPKRGNKRKLSCDVRSARQDEVVKHVKN